jgi:hypothetical protein
MQGFCSRVGFEGWLTSHLRALMARSIPEARDHLGIGAAPRDAAAIG